MRRAWLGVLGGFAVASAAMWMTAVAHRWPLLGLPRYSTINGLDVDTWHLQAFWLTASALVAALLYSHDRALALMALVLGALLFYRGAQLDPTQAILFMLGALVLLVVRHTPAPGRRVIQSVLVGAALAQAAYMLLQAGGLDLVSRYIAPASGSAMQFTGLGGRIIGEGVVGEFTVNVRGTLGQPNSAAALLAIVAPLMPPLGLLLILPALALTYSRSAVLAVTVGLLVRYRHRRSAWLAAGFLLPTLLGVAFLAKGPQSATLSGVARLEVWDAGLRDTASRAPIMGAGLGGWYQRGYLHPKTQEVFAQAHNEYVQWLAETGLVGLVLLGVWLGEHRAMFAHPIWGGSVSALAVDSLAWFPFHVVPLALLGLLVVGLAMTPLTHEPVGA